MRRERRLKSLLEKLSRVRPSNDLEAFAQQAGVPESSLESLRSGARPGTQLDDLRAEKSDLAGSGLTKLRNGDFTLITGREEIQLEAIVERETRPVAFIRQSKFDPLPEPWTSFNDSSPGAPGQRIEQAIPSVGRIEIPPSMEGDSATHVGTGFVVGENLLMTNRHVAALFVVGAGRDANRLSDVPGLQRAIDFRREQGSDRVIRVLIGEILMVHPYWDMAIFRVAGLPVDAVPLPLSVTAPDDLINRQIAVVGYPARYKNPTPTETELEKKHYGGVYGVKRIAPGEVLGRAHLKGLGHRVNAMTHDSSTLPGNSGSALVDVTNGEIIGLHFAGRTLRENYSVPLFELARDRRVVDLGLNFTGHVPPTTQWDSHWRDLGDEQIDVRRSITRLASGITTASPNSLKWTIPLQISVSIGEPSESTVDPSSTFAVAVETPVKASEDHDSFWGRSTGASEDAIVDRAYSRFSRHAIDANTFDWLAANATCAASHLAYADADHVRSVTLGWNLTDTHFISANGTACYVAATQESILIAFRGVADREDWVTDFKFIKKSMPYGSVHMGFQSAFQNVKETVERVIANLGIAGREVVLAGHGFGGALAAIAAAEWHHVFPIRSVFTFGQPRVGHEDFLRHANENFSSAFHRFVNEDDIVTRLPSGNAHVGKLYRLGSDDRPIHETAMSDSVDPPPLTDPQFNLAKAQLKAIHAHRQSQHAPTGSPFQEDVVTQFTNHSIIKYMEKILSRL